MSSRRNRSAMRRDSVLIGLIGAAVLIVVAVVGFLGWRIGHDRATATVTVGGGTTVTSSGGQIDPNVAAGGHDFVQFACGQCHGEQGRGGVSADVPALTEVGKTLTISQLESIIDKGLGESANPTKPFMPV